MKFWVVSKILGSGRNFGLGEIFWVQSKSLGEERNFGSGEKSWVGRGEINFESTKRNKVQLVIK